MPNEGHSVVPRYLGPMIPAKVDKAVPTEVGIMIARPSGREMVK